ncbi:unnamed protein product [Didymodactylos carnosus]|uniref:ADP ribosyltransferase domain-containing protein n=2 Tax=Didymodactylos carnosus TaxID=1234261 RepID=A0A816CW27_9BILA|nr:unnamed protein product [Didymodactylos carnosus]CAF4521951.1 unnamed protein product [Didymodactylos carnosus]
MIETCLEYYQNNKIELEKIKTFHDTYKPEDAIIWYTKDSFVYRLINKALRTEDIDLLYLFRFYIVDLCLQLEHERLSITPLTVYRCQIMSREEFEQFETGMLISTNTFFSTTRKLNIALAFISNALNTSEQVAVLFDIKIEFGLTCIVVCDVDKYSEMSGENEILFSIGTVFKINCMTFDMDQNAFKIVMTATDNGFDKVQEHITATYEQFSYMQKPILFGRLLINMGDYLKAERYYNLMLESVEKDSLDAADIIHETANINYLKGQFTIALLKYKYAYDIRKKYLSDTNHPNIAKSLITIGNVFYNSKSYDCAIEKYKQSLAIYHSIYMNEDHSNISKVLINLGKAYIGKNEHKIALDYLTKALQISRRILPLNHQDIGECFEAIGLAYKSLSDYSTAPQYYIQAFDVYAETLPIEHRRLSRVFNGILDVII